VPYLEKYLAGKMPGGIKMAKEIYQMQIGNGSKTIQEVKRAFQRNIGEVKASKDINIGYDEPDPNYAYMKDRVNRLLTGDMSKSSLLDGLKTESGELEYFSTQVWLALKEIDKDAFREQVFYVLSLLCFLIKAFDIDFYYALDIKLDKAHPLIKEENNEWLNQKK